MHLKVPKEKAGAPLAVADVERKTDFGEYTVTAKEDERYVIFDQRLTVKALEVPATEKLEYARFRSEVLDGEVSILLPHMSGVTTAKGGEGTGAGANKGTAAGDANGKTAGTEDSKAPKSATASTADYRQPLFEAAMRAERNNDYAGSAELLRQAVAADPSYRLAWRALGWNYNYLHDYVRAEAALRKAIELDPDAKREHGDLGVALKGQQKYSEAIPEYKKRD